MRALGLGLIAGVGLPIALHDNAGLMGGLAKAGLFHPPGTGHDIALSAPIFLAVAGLGWALLKVSEQR